MFVAENTVQNPGGSILGTQQSFTGGLTADGSPGCSGWNLCRRGIVLLGQLAVPDEGPVTGGPCTGLPDAPSPGSRMEFPSCLSLGLCARTQVPTGTAGSAPCRRRGWQTGSASSQAVPVVVAAQCRAAGGGVPAVPAAPPLYSLAETPLGSPWVGPASQPRFSR